MSAGAKPGPQFPREVDVPPHLHGEWSERFVKNSPKHTIGLLPVRVLALGPAPQGFTQLGHWPPGTGHAWTPHPHCAVQRESPYSNLEFYAWSIKIHISTVFEFIYIQGGQSHFY